MILMLLIFVSVLLLGLLVRAEWRGRQIAQMSCEQLMAGLHTVSMDHVALIALEYPGLCSKTDGLTVWSMIDGWRGLRRMHANADILLALAEQASAWDTRTSRIALEGMKHDLLLLRKTAIRSFSRHALAHGLELSNSDVYKIASAYHHMTELLLGLYRHSPSRLYTHLETAIWSPAQSVRAI